MTSMQSLINEYTDRAYFSLSPSVHYKYVVNHLAGVSYCYTEPSPDVPSYKEDFDQCNLEFVTNYLDPESLLSCVNSYARNRVKTIERNVSSMRPDIFGGITLSDDNYKYPLSLRLPKYHPYIVCRSEQEYLEVLEQEKSFLTERDFKKIYCLEYRSRDIPMKRRSISEDIHRKMRNLDKARYDYIRSLRTSFYSSTNTTSFDEYARICSQCDQEDDEYVPLRIPLEFRMKYTLPERKDTKNDVEEVMREIEVYTK